MTPGSSCLPGSGAVIADCLGGRIQVLTSPIATLIITLYHHYHHPLVLSLLSPIITLITAIINTIITTIFTHTITNYHPPLPGGDPSEACDGAAEARLTFLIKL